MKVKINLRGDNFTIKKCSKAMLVRKFKKLVAEVTDVPAKNQVLLFGGKMMMDVNDLCDYKIEDGYTIQLIGAAREPMSDITVASSSASCGQKTDLPKKEAKDEDLDKPADGKENEELSLTREEEKARLREIGAVDLLKEMEDQEAQPEEPCKKCKGVESRKCKECGCNQCGGKDQPDKQLFCEVCKK